MYLALYRKYRPKNFDEVIGQQPIIQTLKNQITNNKVGHAYLFCGSRGTGKTSTAKIFARQINCKCGGAGTCEFCMDKPSLDIIEIDAASNNGVDEIRDLREKIKYPPVEGKYKVYIIDEVHMLSSSAFNALLKTLEEPPKHAVFILATTEVHKLPATILSRCMRFDFSLLSVEELSKLLVKIFNEEKISYDEQSINLISRAGEGSVRDTLSIADRCVSFSGDNLTGEKVIEVLGATEKQSLIAIADCILNKSLGQTLQALDKVLSGGKSPVVLAKDLVFYFRDLLIINTLKDKANSMVIANAEDYKQMQNQAIDQYFSKITRAIEIISGADADLRYSFSPRIVLENCIIKLYSQDNLQDRVEKLEKILANGVPAITSKLAQPISVANVNPVTKPAEKTATTNQSGEKLLGNLLGYLREQKYMSLLMACRQIIKINIEDKLAKMYIKDVASIEMITSEKYSKILTEYLDNLGLNWQVVKMGTGGNLEDLTKKLGGRLQIQ